MGQSDVTKLTTKQTVTTKESLLNQGLYDIYRINYKLTQEYSKNMVTSQYRSSNILFLESFCSLQIPFYTCLCFFEIMFIVNKYI